MSLISPKATRDGKRLRKRIQNESQKAYDKYKLAEEQLEAEKLLSKVKDEAYDSDQDDKDASDATRGMYFVNIDSADATDGNDSESSYSTTAVYFKSSCMNKFYRKFLSTEKRLKLSWSEFIGLMVSLQVPIGYLSRHVTLLQTFGATLVLIVYVFIGLLLAIPLYMMYMFLGNYTRRSYIRYWDCVPLLRGVAYAITMSSLFLELFNVGTSAIALYYVMNIFSREIPWTSCKFSGKTSACVPLKYDSSYTGHTMRCCRENYDPNCTPARRSVTVLKYSSFEYFNNHVMRIGYGPSPLDTSYIIPLIVIVELIWALIYVLIVIGFRRYVKAMTIINFIICAVLAPVVIFTFIVSPRYTTIDAIKSNYSSLEDYRFWLRTGMHILHRDIPGHVFTFSASSKPGISIVVDSVTIYAIKFFITTMYSVWMSLGVKYLQEKYKVTDNNCIISNSYTLMFAVFPDVISRLPVPQIFLIIYFLLIFFWGVATATYTYNSFLRAIIEMYPKLEKWRWLVGAAMCLGAGIGNAFFMNAYFMEHYHNLVAMTIVDQKIIILFASLTGAFLYTLERFKNDYHFHCGVILHPYWTNGIKIGILAISLGTMALVIARIMVVIEKNYFIIFFFCSPILLGIIISSIRYSLKITKTLISPNSRWGPPNTRQKLARIRFDRAHDLRFRSLTHSCNHNCLLQSSVLKKEIKYWFNRREQFLQQQENSVEQWDPVTSDVPK